MSEGCVRARLVRIAAMVAGVLGDGAGGAWFLSLGYGAWVSAAGAGWRAVRRVSLAGFAVRQGSLPGAAGLARGGLTRAGYAG